MGWFDQETKAGGGAPVTAPDTQQRAATPTPAGGGREGSTIGQRVQVNGTVVSDEDLEIVGKVEGTIHARKGLRVAREADVKAVINGSEVLVEGTVTGDINASEQLVLGATAVLTGNIKTPSLQIRDGAFFRGQVTMQRPEKAVTRKAEAGVEAKTQKARAPEGTSGSSAQPQRGAETNKESASSVTKPAQGKVKPTGMGGA